MPYPFDKNDDELLRILSRSAGKMAISLIELSFDCAR